MLFINAIHLLAEPDDPCVYFPVAVSFCRFYSQQSSSQKTALRRALTRIPQRRQDRAFDDIRAQRKYVYRNISGVKAEGVAAAGEESKGLGQGFGQVLSPISKREEAHNVKKSLQLFLVLPCLQQTDCYAMCRSDTTSDTFSGRRLVGESDGRHLALCPIPKEKLRYYPNVTGNNVHRKYARGHLQLLTK